MTAEDFTSIVMTGDDFSWYGAASHGTPFWFVVDADGVVRQVEQQYVP